MLVESCFQLGVITKSHGILGNVILFLDTDFPESYHKLESVFVEIKQKLVPFLIESMKIQGSKAIVKFEGINDIVEASELKNKNVYLPLEYLPALDPDQFYYHDVIGFTVIDKTHGKLGRIVNIYEASGNDIFAVSHRKKEILIPIRDELILKTDKTIQEIYVDLPAGLIEIYLDL